LVALVFIAAAPPQTPPTKAPAPAAAERPETFKVHEGWSTLWVDTHAPYPSEITDETQARALAKNAAVVLGQNELLKYIAHKRARSGRTLEVAQIPSTELQDQVKGFIQGAQVSGVRFDKNGCRLRVSASKANLKVILRKG
jgi:hypothetical protein